MTVFKQSGGRIFRRRPPAENKTKVNITESQLLYDTEMILVEILMFVSSFKSLFSNSQEWRVKVGLNGFSFTFIVLQKNLNVQCSTEVDHQTEH